MNTRPSIFVHCVVLVLLALVTPMGFVLSFIAIAVVNNGWDNDIPKVEEVVGLAEKAIEKGLPIQTNTQGILSLILVCSPLEPLSKPRNCPKFGPLTGFCKVLLEPLTKPNPVIVIDQDTPQGEESQMQFIVAVIANGQSAKAFEPRDRAFDDPPSSLYQLRVTLSPLGQDGRDVPCRQADPQPIGIIALIPGNLSGLFHRRPDFATDGRDSIDQRQRHLHIRHVGGTHQRHYRQTVARLDQHMVLATRFAAIYRAGASFCPPKTARTLLLSTMVCTRSISPAARSQERIV